MHYRKFDTHSRLRKVVLGRYFPDDYFDFIKDKTVRDSLMKISREINEDLDHFQNILVEHGVTVLRPELASKKAFVEHWDIHGTFLTPPLQPRNYHTVIGNKIYQLTHGSCTDYINGIFQEDVIDLCQSNQEVFDTGCKKNIKCYNPTLDQWYCRDKYQELAGPDWPDFYDYVMGARSANLLIAQELDSFKDALCYETKEFTQLMAPNLFPVDGKLYVDCKEYFDYQPWVKKHIDFDGEIIVLNSKAAHSDGCFVVLGNKVIIGIAPGIDYDRFFPGYRVVKASDNYMEAVTKRKEIQSLIQKRWWVVGEENNSKLNEYVDTYMQNYVGNAYETSFDLNVLAIDSENICMIQNDPAVVQELNSYGINVIDVPWRHRFFVDCGLHCLTLDLYRED